MSREVDVKALISHIVRGDGADKCRICMGDTSEGQVFLGDTVMMDGERPVTLAELLEVITGVEIEEETLCPNGVCVTCTSTALAAQEFCLFVHTANNAWHKAINAVKEIPKPFDTSVNSICTFIKPDSFQSHTVEDYTADEPGTILNRVKQRLTKKDCLEEKKSSGSRVGPLCICPDCGKSFTSPCYLSKHLKNSDGKEACTRCGRVFARGTELRDHLLKVHGKDWLICKSCPSLFSSEHGLQMHVTLAHRPGYVTCKVCGRIFHGRASLAVHTQMHTVTICRACGMQFTNRSCDWEHRRKCVPDARPNLESYTRSKDTNICDPATFECDYCGKTYFSRSQLENHIIWIHMNVRPRQCQWCGKRFNTPARFAEHSVVHTREVSRGFECEICGAKLESKRAAIYHRRRHTGEKPYQCGDCGEHFISASERLEHDKRKHGMVTRVQCLQCPASFVRRLELKKHMEIMHRTQGFQLNKGKAQLGLNLSTPIELHKNQYQ